MEATSLGSSRSAERWFLAALLLLFVAAGVHYSVKVTTKDTASAFLRWRAQLLQLDQGTDIWRAMNYPNPPIMALLLRPLAGMPPLTGALTWFYLKVVMALAAIHWAIRLVELPARPMPAWARCLTVALTLRPVLGDLSHGNINIFILFVVMAALYAYRHGRDGLCGLLLGLSIACKVTPLLFVPYFLWKRAWRVLAGCALGLVLFFAVMPGLVLGWQDNAEKLNSWYNQMAKPYIQQGKVFYSEHNNQSLPGLLVRLLSHSPSFSHYEHDILVPDGYHNVANLSHNQIGWLARGCMGLFALLIVFTCRTPTEDARQGWRLATEFALVFLGMLLFSERTWKHHCVTLLLPFAVLCYYLAACRPRPRQRGYLIGTLAAVALLMTLTTTGPFGAHHGKLAEVYGAYTWSCLLLAAALATLLRSVDELPLPERRLPARRRQTVHEPAAAPLPAELPTV